jgi:AraC family transcriptional regulator
MYLTALPDHSQSSFDEKKHFSMFGNTNVVVNASATRSQCDHHIGCLSIKTVLTGEEWYGVNGTPVAVRPGAFLLLNDGQDYSCRIDGMSTNTVSVFFARDFARSILRDFTNDVGTLIDDPFERDSIPEFFSVLHPFDNNTKRHLSSLINSLETEGHNANMVDERLVFLLSDLIRIHRGDLEISKNIYATRSSTKKEVYKRVCIARDFLHSFYNEDKSLKSIASASSLSVPQLVRQFKAAFGVTPHRYLVNIRLQRAADLLRCTATPVTEIAASCGFENASAFSRVFKGMYGIQPGRYRELPRRLKNRLI